MKTQDGIITIKRLPALLLLWCMLTWSFSSCFQSKLLVRKIHSKPNNITHAINILTQMDAEKNDDKYTLMNAKSIDKDLQNVVVAALRICGNTNNHDLALNLYNKYQSEATRAMSISVLGSCNKISKVLELLEDDFCPPSAASFNAAIAACGRTGNWQVARDIYQKQMPKEMITSLSTNALLTVLAKSRQGVHALEILDHFVEVLDQFVPTTMPKAGSDSITYTLVISALVRSNMLTEASEILQDLKTRQHYCSPKSIEAMIDLVLSSYSQRSDWSGVERIEQIRNQNQYNENESKLHNKTDVSSFVHISPNDYRFHEWEGLERLGKGKEAYWVIGTYQNTEELNITIGCRPHRNPSRNGIQILFYENVFDDETSSWGQRKIGYLLMKNNWKERTSSMLGMFLNPTERGRGVSKVCLSIWIWLCLKGSIVPVTGILRKPLLSLILQHTFGFVDSTENNGGRAGNLVEISQDPDDPKCVVLYSLSGKCLEGALSLSDMRHQNIKISSQQPLVRGRVVRIGSRLYPPSDETNLQMICDKILSRNSWKCELSWEELQLILLGRKLE
jgi:pentatricopeptide repeat protein